jgi:hypothetical protein
MLKNKVVSNARALFLRQEITSPSMISRMMTLIWIASLRSNKNWINHFFMELIILCYWAMGMTRNRNIFKRIQPNLNTCKASFKSELKWLQSSATRKKHGLSSAWVDNFI